jgi:hypothetical protein
VAAKIGKHTKDDVPVFVGSLNDSKFFQRLCACDDTAEYQALLKDLWSGVSATVTRICNEFGTYTLHDMTHIGNVIGLMEHFVPGDVWKKPWQKKDHPLGPQQCLLCLASALIHDLGMAPGEEVLEQLHNVEVDGWQPPPDASAEILGYHRHFHAQEEEVRLIRMMEKEPSPRTHEIEAKKQAIRTEYLRRTHTDDAFGPIKSSRDPGEIHRIREWLIRENFEKRFPTADFFDYVADVALSHGQSLEWLSRRLGTEDRPCQPEMDLGEDRLSPLHAACLLRLADVCDMDASRAPRTIYRDFIAPKAAKSRPSKAAAISREHWMLHLCVERPAFDWQKRELSYLAKGRCANPDIHEALNRYMEWVRQEVYVVQNTIDSNPGWSKHFPIRLPKPEFISHNVRIEDGWASRPVRFELTHREIIQILMGEELYGDPSLCLRELVQNSLDALHLRDLRDKLRDKASPVELQGLEPVDRVGRNESLRVVVRWGQEDFEDDRWPEGKGRKEKRHFIEVEDNGIGMTLRVIEKYFSQLGRSFYQSEEYRRERAVLRRHGLPVSEISQFGIGFLSCFMIAERVDVWSRPAEASDDPPGPHQIDRRAQLLRIWGADGLFWHKPIKKSDLPNCGTKVRMWMKQGWSAGCWDKEVLKKIEQVYYGDSWHFRTDSAGLQNIDPVWTVWKNTVWPRHEICFEDNGRKCEDWTLSGESHLTQILPINSTEVNNTVAKCFGVTPENLPDQIGWKYWDWEDPLTASRVRLAVPAPGIHGAEVADCFENLVDPLRGQAGTFPFSFLPAAVEGHLPSTKRSRLLVRGMEVVDLTNMDSEIGQSPITGSLLWVDLSGHAAPRLKADRSGITRGQREDQGGEFKRVIQDWREELERTIGKTPWWVRDTILQPVGSRFSEPATRHWNANDFNWETETERILKTLALQQLGSEVFERDSVFEDADEFAINTELDIARDIARTRDLDLANELAHNLSSSPSLAHAHARDIELKITHALALLLAFDKEFELETSMARTLGRDINHTDGFQRRIQDSTNPVGKAFKRLRLAGVLAEGFYPNLEHSNPALRLPPLDSPSHQARLIGPWELQFGEWGVTTGTSLSVPLETYDLVHPFSHIPLGTLRHRCPAWGVERACRAMAMLPFIYSGSLNWKGFRKLLVKLDEHLGLLSIDHILFLFPSENLCTKRFTEWDPETAGNEVVSACWEVEENRVRWAEGFHTVESIRKEGKTIEEWLGLNHRE